jgi:hypothetical protein
MKWGGMDHRVQVWPIKAQNEDEEVVSKTMSVPCSESATFLSLLFIIYTMLFWDELLNYYIVRISVPPYSDNLCHQL